MDPDLARVVRTIEERFPCPDWAAVYSEEEDGSRALLLSHRIDGILQPIVLVDVDDLFGVESTGDDWMAEIETLVQQQLAK